MDNLLLKVEKLKYERFFLKPSLLEDKTMTKSLYRVKQERYWRERIRIGHMFILLKF